MSGMKVFKFDVDENFAKQHNEMVRDTRSLVASGIAIFVISVIVGVAVWFLVDPSSPWHWLGSFGAVLFGVLMLVVALLIPRSVGKTQEIYDSNPLAPAIITERAGTTVTLTALVNLNVDPALPPRWAITSRVMQPLPNTSDKVGTKVPVAAVGAQRSARDQQHWQTITPMPIAWGTPDEAVVASARKSIPQDQWSTLERARKKSEFVVQELAGGALTFAVLSGLSDCPRSTSAPLHFSHATYPASVRSRVSYSVRPCLRDFVGVHPLLAWAWLSAMQSPQGGLRPQMMRLGLIIRVPVVHESTGVPCLPRSMLRRRDWFVDSYNSWVCTNDGRRGVCPQCVSPRGRRQPGAVS